MEVRCATTADADAVWTVLADGWRLASWVVGAARVQAVDPGWPQVGATLTCGIGAWPLVLPGAARVTQCWPSRALALHGDAPFGGIDVVVNLGIRSYAPEVQAVLSRGPMRVVVRGDAAWVSSTSSTTGEYRGRQVDSSGAELMVLSRTPQGWRIAAIHWSSRTRRPPGG